jgi:hypothetical protein
VASRSKAWDCGRLRAGGKDVRLLWVLCVVRQRSLRQADPLSRGIVPSESLNVIKCNSNLRHLQWEGRRQTKKEGRKVANYMIMFLLLFSYLPPTHSLLLILLPPPHPPHCLLASHLLLLLLFSFLCTPKYRPLCLTLHPVGFIWKCLPFVIHHVVYMCLTVLCWHGCILFDDRLIFPVTVSDARYCWSHTSSYPIQDHSFL